MVVVVVVEVVVMVVVEVEVVGWVGPALDACALGLLNTAQQGSSARPQILLGC